MVIWHTSPFQIVLCIGSKNSWYQKYFLDMYCPWDCTYGFMLRHSYWVCNHRWKGNEVRPHGCPSGPRGACTEELEDIHGWMEGEVMIVDSSAYGGGYVACQHSCSSTAPVLQSGWGRLMHSPSKQTDRSHISSHCGGKVHRNPWWYRWWSRTQWPSRARQHKENKSPRSAPVEIWSVSSRKSGYTSFPSQTPEMPGLRWYRRAPWEPGQPNLEEGNLEIKTILWFYD